MGTRPLEEGSTDSRGSEVSSGMRYATAGPNCENLASAVADTSLGAMATLAHPSERRASLPAHRSERPPGCTAAELNMGSGLQMRTVQENQGEEEVSNKGIQIHRKETAGGAGRTGGERIRKAGVSSDGLSRFLCNISFLQATFIKLEKNTHWLFPTISKRAY